MLFIYKSYTRLQRTAQVSVLPANILNWCYWYCCCCCCTRGVNILCHL